jgi:hypothetical protein
MVDVPASNVRLVAVVNTTGLAPLKVTVDALSKIDLTFELLELIAAGVKAWLLALVLKAPAVTVNVLVAVKALPSVQPPPTPFKTTSIAPSVTVLVVIVFPVVVAKKLIVAPVVVVNTTPVAALVQLP